MRITPVEFVVGNDSTWLLSDEQMSKTHGQFLWC